MVLSTFRVVDAVPTNENDVTLPVTQVKPAVTLLAHFGGVAFSASGGGGGVMRSAASANLRVESRISFRIAFSSSSAAGFAAAAAAGAGASVCERRRARMRTFMV